MEMHWDMHHSIKPNFMQNIQHISIPTPCHQSWQDMTPVNESRNCSHCSKTVTDFTAMTNSQIINYLATSSNVCGRIDQQRLNAINQQLQVEEVSITGKFKGWTLAIGLLGSMAFFKADAQTKPAVEQIVNKSPVRCDEPMLGKIAYAPVSIRVIKGIVMDENNQPLPGVTIFANQNIATQSDVAGKFTLHVSLGVQQFKVSFIGYVAQIVTVDNSNIVYQIKLKEVPQMLGEVVIMKRPSFIKRTYYRYIKKPIYKLFK